MFRSRTSCRNMSDAFARRSRIGRRSRTPRSRATSAHNTASSARAVPASTPIRASARRRTSPCRSCMWSRDRAMPPTPTRSKSVSSCSRATSTSSSRTRTANASRPASGPGNAFRVPPASSTAIRTTALSRSISRSCSGAASPRPWATPTRTSTSAAMPISRRCELRQRVSPGDLHMRRVLAVAAAVALAAPAHAQEAWPQRPVTIVVPFAAGGSADLLARILQQHLQAKFGVPFVVENKSGAGGSIGTGFVAKAPADGYTLLVGTVSSIAINAFLYTKLNFDVARDLQPVSLLVRFPNLLFVNPKVPARSVPELIDYLKANNGKTNYGSSGIGTSSHLSSVMFELATNTKMTHVPFRSTAEVVNSMLGGNIELAIDSMTTVWPFAAAGNVRALAVTTPRRSAAAPDLPTIGETLKGYEATAWQGLFAPAGTARAIVDKIAAEVKQVWELEEVIAALKNVGAEPAPSTPDEFATYIAAERGRWGEVVKVSGVKLD